MSETSGSNPNTTGDIGNLPQDFLGADRYRLEVSASRARSMADLRQGHERLNGNFGVSIVVANGCRHYEDPNAIRHVKRGAALTQLLLDESVPGFAPDNGGYIAHITDLEPQRNPRRDAFKVVRDELVEARRSAVLSGTWRLTPEEIAQNEGAFRQQVDGVLAQAGLSGSFETAVAGLTGPGLEEPTRELDAKYGAVLVALGVGITED